MVYWSRDVFQVVWETGERGREDAGREKEEDPSTSSNPNLDAMVMAYT